MSEPVTVDLGAVTAYADAVEQGYTGTREEFGELLANFAKRADEVKEDRNAVEQAKDEVFQKADNFDEHIEAEKVRVTEEFNSNAEQVLNTNKQELGTVKDNALEEIVQTKEESVTEITNTKNSGVKEITDLTNINKSLLENTGTNQKNLIESEGTKQIQAVENKGTATLATIPEDYTALNTSVSDLNDLIHTKAPAIVEEATSGKEITVNDSADGMRLQGMNVYGKSWQETTTGKNLINADEYYLRFKQSDGTYKAKTVILNDIRVPLDKFVGKDVTLSVKATVATGTTNVYIAAYINSKRINGSYVASGLTGKSTLKVTPVSSTDYFIISYGSGNDDVTFSELQLELGSVATSYEPYTGGKPSPSPEYPQEIESVGRVLSTGKNLVNLDAIKNVGWAKTVSVPESMTKLSNDVYTISMKIDLINKSDNFSKTDTAGFGMFDASGKVLKYETVQWNDNKTLNLHINILNTFDWSKIANVIIYGCGNNQIGATGYANFYDFQIEKGTEATTYEPYTGGVPALYQKDIEVKLTGKNLSSIKSCQLSTKRVKSGIIPWTKKGAIYFSCDTENVTDSGVNVGVIYYDENKNRIGGNGEVLKTDGKRNETFFTGSGAGSNITNIDLTTVSYVIVQIGLLNDTYKTSFVDNIMLCDEANQPYEPYHEPQSLPITTPTGLPAIPVPSGTSGITYTDTDGQAWIADEIDFTRGKYIQRVWQAEFDGSEDEVWARYSVRNGWVCSNGLPENMKGRNGFCNEKKVGVVDRDEIQLGSKSSDDNKVFYPNSKYYDASLSDYGLSNWKAHLAEHPLKVMTYLDNPIETDLSEEQIQAYKAVHTNKPTTIISNDADAWMGASYAADTKLYIDSKVQEIASAVIASASEAE